MTLISQQKASEISFFSVEELSTEETFLTFLWDWSQSRAAQLKAASPQFVLIARFCLGLRDLMTCDIGETEIGETYMNEVIQALSHSEICTYYKQQ